MEIQKKIQVPGNGKDTVVACPKNRHLNKLTDNIKLSLDISADLEDQVMRTLADIMNEVGLVDEALDRIKSESARKLRETSEELIKDTAINHGSVMQTVSKILDGESDD